MTIQDILKGAIRNFVNYLVDLRVKDEEGKLKTKNADLAEKAQKVGGTLLAIKGPDTPLSGKTYIFREGTKWFESRLLEKYQMSKEDIDGRVEKPAKIVAKPAK